MEDACFFYQQTNRCYQLACQSLDLRVAQKLNLLVQQRRARFVWGNKWGTLDEQTGRFKKHR